MWRFLVSVLRAGVGVHPDRPGGSGMLKVLPASDAGTSGHLSLLSKCFPFSASAQRPSPPLTQVTTNPPIYGFSHTWSLIYSTFTPSPPASASPAVDLPVSASCAPRFAARSIPTGERWQFPASLPPGSLVIFLVKLLQGPVGFSLAFCPAVVVFLVLQSQA